MSDHAPFASVQLLLLFLRTILRIVLIPCKLIISLFRTIFPTGVLNSVDPNHRWRDDFHIATYFITGVSKYVWSVYSNRFQYWYLFEGQVKKNPNSLAISYPKPLAAKGEFELQQFTYLETYRIVLRLSYYLYNVHQVKPGDFVALDYTNKPMFIFLWFALWNIGATPAFLNYNILGQPLIHCIQTSNISQIFVDPQAAGPIKKTNDELEKSLPHTQLHFIDEDELFSNVLLNENYPTLRTDDSIRSPQTAKDFEAAMLIYTSGTTGLPKPAIMSWRKATIGCSLFGRIMRVTPGQTVFTAMPLYHSTAALLGVCAIFAHGGCVAISNKFSASTFWKQVCLTESTHIQYVGEVCRYLLNSPVSPYEKQHHVKIAYGNGLKQDIWKEFKERFNIGIIGEFYASTESPFATTSLQRGDFGIGACRNYGPIVSMVLSMQQCLVKVDPDDETIIYRNEKGFAEAPDVGQPGELLMRIFVPKRPETSFQGYMGNKKDTESKVVRDVFRKGDAWYRSGDLLKSDSNGLWYFMDRLGDTFRWKSENVSATEVENQIMSFTKTVILETVVVGVKLPSNEGRAGFAILRLQNKDMSIEDKLDLLNTLLPHLKENLPKYALPIFIKFADEIQLTHTHKVAKNIYRNQALPHGDDGSETVFWLCGYEKYQLLTDEDWSEIAKGTNKI
ncbi:unnamed protein product [Kluyveromyces dobzhanskii CBS 2104]|uniref:Very long-chain fatty acid transport protein n=1 Tax=Kluyveromyces dobzhanskii CBS 2104 TaxID=1427455 RepID=A0A0A8L243_9SACH|nr:unnamed protein product [Kluyveromyces dobzhanskii CBS 2104]